MKDSDFVKIMKANGFTEKEISTLITISRRDSSDLQSDLKDLAIRFYRILFSFTFLASLMVLFLCLGEFDGSKLFLFSIFVFVFSILWYHTPVKFSYKSHRMYKKM